MTTSAEDLKQQLDELTEPQLQRIADFIAFSKFANQSRKAFAPVSSEDVPPYNVSHLASMIKDLTEGERQDLIKELHPNQYSRDKLNDFVLAVKNTIIDFTFNNTDFKIFSLNDHDYRNLSKYFIRLDFSYCFNPTFWRTSNRIFNGGWWQDSSDTKIIAHLGFVYWILNHLFGESSQIVYEAKSTFAFRFYLEVKKQDKIYPYAFAIFDYRNCVEFSFYRCSHEETKPTSSLEKPNEAEFSSDEIDKFILYFLGYLLGHFQLVKEQITPFERVITSNAYVYGYSKEKGFFEYEKKYED